MRVALDYAEKSSQVKSNFLRLVSHELRTPLTVLQLQLQRLERDAEQTMTERQRTIIDRISGASRRLLDLIESLLEYARIESGRLQLHVEPTDLNFLVGEVVSELEPQATRRNLEIRFSPTTEVPLLASDPRLIRLILVNLVGNAIKFTEDGYVEVQVGNRAGPAPHYRAGHGPRNSGGPAVGGIRAVRAPGAGASEAHAGRGTGPGAGAGDDDGAGRDHRAGIRGGPRGDVYGVYSAGRRVGAGTSRKRDRRDLIAPGATGIA